VSYCPECEAVIDDGQIEDIGDIVSCPECGVELEVVSLDPVEFDLALVDEDDEDDYDFDDEDDEDWDDDDDDAYDDDDLDDREDEEEK